MFSCLSSSLEDELSSCSCSSDICDHTTSEYHYPIWSSTSSPLLSLPPELHHFIVSHLCNISDIHCLSETCSYFALLTVTKRLALAATDERARALRWAARNNNTSLMHQLLSKSVEVHEKLLVTGQKGINHFLTGEVHYSALEIAMEEGREEMLRVMLECAREAVVARLATCYDHGMEALARNGNIEMLKTVLGYIKEWEKKNDEDGGDDGVEDEDQDQDEDEDSNEDSSNSSDSNYEEDEAISRAREKKMWEAATIQEAEQFDKIAAVEFLLDSGFWSPGLGHAAARNGYLEMLQMLVSRGLVRGSHSNRRHRKSVKAQDLLESAVCAGSEVAVQFLLENGADVNAITDTTRGRTPAHFAAAESRPAIMSFLLSKGADINATTQDEDGKCSLPLHLAAEFDAVEVLELLLKHGVDDINATDGYGQTALHRCADVFLYRDEDRSGSGSVNMTRIRCAWLLMQHDAVVDKIDDMGYTPMDIAVKLGRLGQARLFVIVRTRQVMDMSYEWVWEEIENMGITESYYI